MHSRIHSPRALWAGALLALTALVPGLLAEGAKLQDRVREIQLDNGLKVLLVPRGQAPVFSGLIKFNVGGVDEVPGITGLAHLFEHMAFKGTTVIGTKNYAGEKEVLDAIDEVATAYSKELGKWDKADAEVLKKLKAELDVLQRLHKRYAKKDEFTSIYNKHGASGMNATTSKDYTTYFVNLPANRLELWMLLESERLIHPVMREFYLERDVVREERKMRTENSPTGKLYEQFVAAGFSAHPYRFPTVGWDADIRTVTRSQAQDFYDRFYSPKNAVVALVGRFDMQAAEALVRKYFGRWKNKAEIRRPTTQEPPQVGERRVEIFMDSKPHMFLGWHQPVLPHPDAYALEVLGGVLAGSRTTRLYRRLVETKKAQAVGVYTVPGERYPNLFTLSVAPLAGQTLESLDQEIEAELAAVQTELLPEREVQKVVNQLESDLVWAMASNQGLAQFLTRMHLLTGDWKFGDTYLEEIRKVTPERIREAAKKVFRKENKTVALLRTKPQPQEKAEVSQ